VGYVRAVPLPPLASLEAFSAAARTRSVKEAARELHLSPSALSRQISALEDHLGTALFLRLPTGLELTPSGRRYLATVAQVLVALRDAQEALAPQRGPLRVSALESFCAKWMVPRLGGFRAAHPGVELEIEATLRYADFDRDPVDVAIRFGTGPWEGLHSEPIVDLEFTPVFSPALRDADPPLRTIDDLARHPWIHVSQVPDAWRDWTRAVGRPDLTSPRDVTYDHVGIALSAAEAGQGIALGTNVVAARDLAEGRLCAPFPRAHSDQTYHLVCREEGLLDPRITAFRDWLVASLEEPRSDGDAPTETS
jgi:LysR family transcriptional regulator, glycine cleavage system transcriptional activator